MRPKPKTTYATASPQTWELIRAAYLSGLSAPTAAARFGVSVTALRKRAAREGWTKAAFARARAPLPACAPAHPPPPAPLPAPAHGARVDDIPLRIEAIVARQMIPLFEEPTAMARRALGQAQRQIAEGRGLEAAQMVRAAKELHALEDYIPAARYFFDEDEESDYDGRREHMRVMLRTIALNLAEMIAAGKPLPAEFEGLRAVREEDFE
ncbi:MAG TPA: hypothetical protein VF138_09980 [Caulobacteraceae bacterium]